MKTIKTLVMLFALSSTALRELARDGKGMARLSAANTLRFFFNEEFEDEPDLWY